MYKTSYNQSNALQHGDSLLCSVNINAMFSEDHFQIGVLTSEQISLSEFCCSD